MYAPGPFSIISSHWLYPDRDKILEGLRHFPSLDVEVSGMEKILHPIVVRICSLTLCNLVGVVRETQVYTTTVHV